MQSAKKVMSKPCPHKDTVKPHGLALITIGNSLRADDGVAISLCNVLPVSALQDVCRFDLGSYTGLLRDCLSGHKAAIIIDSTQNGTTPGTISLVDLGAMMDRATTINVGSCHGFSLADELRIAKHCGRLPQRLIFFGVEVSTVDWTEKLSPGLEAKLPQLCQNLATLISVVLETLKKDA